jgi:hypothetical protein
MKYVAYKHGEMTFFSEMEKRFTVEAKAFAFVVLDGASARLS